jgi:hypothetical protein
MRIHLDTDLAGDPDDLLNFQYDPVAVAVALCWHGVRTEDLPLRPAERDGDVWFEPHPHGRAARVVTDVHGEAFAQEWLAAVEAAQRR